MNVFSDMHHSDLYHALSLLFEKRLGANLYRPIGLEWWQAGYWQYYHLEPTVRQFLSMDQGFRPGDGTHPLNTIADVVDGVYYVHDPANEAIHKAITLETFDRMDIDVVIASVPAHWRTFARLIAERKPGAKLVCQLGNQWSINPAVCKNVLASVEPVPIPSGVNAVFYHQEFDLDIFRYEPPVPGSRIISSFMNVLAEGGRATDFDRYRRLLPEFEFRSYGSQNEHGVLSPHGRIAEAMHESLFIWHVKPGGDGFGHIIHNAFACGRPVITRKSHYANGLAGELMIDGVTCLDLDTHSAEDACRFVRGVEANPDWHERLCQSARARFEKVVDYDAEEIRIREWLGRLV